MKLVWVLIICLFISCWLNYIGIANNRMLIQLGIEQREKLLTLISTLTNYHLAYYEPKP